MAMSPPEMVSFFEEQSALFSEGMQAARERADSEHLLFAAGEVFKAHAMSALLRWRHGLGEPREWLEKAIDVAEEVLGDPPGSRKDLWQLFPLGPAGYFAFLLGRDSRVLHEPRRQGSISEGDVNLLEHDLDIWLLNALNDDHDSDFSPEGVGSVPKRMRLLVTTYQCYGRLLNASGDERKALVSEAEALFRERRKNSFFSGGSELSGGGPDNDHVVDFVLAAVLKKIDASGLSPVHGWRW